MVASHLSNVPSMETEALTANRTELPSFGIWITGISVVVCASSPFAKNIKLAQTTALAKMSMFTSTSKMLLVGMGMFVSGSAHANCIHPDLQSDPQQGCQAGI